MSKLEITERAVIHKLLVERKDNGYLIIAQFEMAEVREQTIDVFALGGEPSHEEVLEFVRRLPHGRNELVTKEFIARDPMEVAGLVATLLGEKC